MPDTTSVTSTFPYDEKLVAKTRRAYEACGNSFCVYLLALAALTQMADAVATGRDALASTLCVAISALACHLLRQADVSMAMRHVYHTDKPMTCTATMHYRDGTASRLSVRISTELNEMWSESVGLDEVANLYATPSLYVVKLRDGRILPVSRSGFAGKRDREAFAKALRHAAKSNGIQDFTGTLYRVFAILIVVMCLSNIITLVQTLI